ncbi:MAG: hypothetical protein ACOC35_11145 [Promethearchaeia archaeon]
MKLTRRITNSKWKFSKLDLDDNAAQILVKIIINKVHKNEKKLVKQQKENGNKHKFKFIKGKDRFTRGRYGGIEMISATNLAKFFCTSQETLKKWLDTIEDPNFAIGLHTYQEIIFRKTRSNVLMLFSGEGSSIANGRELIQCALDNYMERHFSEMDYILKIAFLLDDCAVWTKGWKHSLTNIGRKTIFGENFWVDARSKIQDKPASDFSKYFKKTTAILLIKYNDFEFIDKESYRKFKEGSIDIIFEEMERKEICGGELRPQYEAIVYTLYALTLARISKYGGIENIPAKYTHPKNPAGIYTLVKLSEEVSDFDRRHTIQDKFKNNTFLDNEKVVKIARLLEGIKTDAPDIYGVNLKNKCELALEKLEEIPNYRVKSRPSYVGFLSHPLWEDLFQRALKDFDDHHEFYLHYPESYHQIDTFIDFRTSRALSLNEELARKLGIDLSKIKELSIDYTIPSASSPSDFKNNVLIKITKNYHSKERSFITAFYGSYNENVFRMLNRTKDEYIREHNIKYAENCYHMDIKDLARLLGMENEFLEEIETINILIIRALMNDDKALAKLEDLSKKAVFRLSESGRYHNTERI